MRRFRRPRCCRAVDLHGDRQLLCTQTNEDAQSMTTSTDGTCDRANDKEKHERTHGIIAGMKFFWRAVLPDAPENKVSFLFCDDHGPDGPENKISSLFCDHHGHA